MGGGLCSKAGDVSSRGWGRGREFGHVFDQYLARHTHDLINTAARFRDTF